MTRQQRAAVLRQQLATADRTGAGKPFPEHLRRAVVAYTAEALADGGSVDATARELGISAMSIQRWTARLSEASTQKGTLQRVEIMAEPGELVLDNQGSRFVVHTPNGLRVEGLTVAAVVQLVRALG